MISGWVLYLVYVFVGLIAAAWLWHTWQRKGGAMTGDEVDAFIKVINEQVDLPAEFKDEFLVRLREFGMEDNGKPIVNLNLIRFYDELLDLPGIDRSLVSTPEEGNNHYMDIVTSAIVSVGGFPIYTGNVSGKSITPSTPIEEKWHKIICVYYPNRRTFMRLVAHPDYARCAPYKIGSLRIVLIPTEVEMSTPGGVTFVSLLTLLLHVFFTITKPFRK